MKMVPITFLLPGSESRGSTSPPVLGSKLLAGLSSSRVLEPLLDDGAGELKEWLEPQDSPSQGLLKE